MAFSVFGLVVGVSNDAVNFLNSSIGSRVAPRKVIIFIASIGIILGVIFSSGMMEIAQKGIFNPEYLTMPEIMIIFLAVAFTNVVLLDLFNTFGLPTSTTVAVIFGLLGGSFAVSWLKIAQINESFFAITEYIDTTNALVIVFGIFLSVVLAFLSGSIIQFISRLIFTFDYKKRLKRYGALWGAVALTSILYFIFIKGASSASFISKSQLEWILSHQQICLLIIFIVSAVTLQTLLFLKINIFKPIILAGTFALAMSFAANDLVNFIGVSVSGLNAYNLAPTGDARFTTNMTALSESVQTNPLLLLGAGLIMAMTLWFSKKARTVSETELKLVNQSEGDEKYDSTLLSRIIVYISISIISFVKSFTPRSLKKWMSGRLDTSKYTAQITSDNRPSFDLLRATVNLMVASALISYGTSFQLPLSTTYVTFMVSMGTSFSDRAWGRESAVYRITGVLTVIGGWFFTALMAFLIASIMAVVMFYAKVVGVIALLAIILCIVWKSHRKHGEIQKNTSQDEVYNLKKVTNFNEAVEVSLSHMGLLIKDIRQSLNKTLEGLYLQNGYTLREERKNLKHIQKSANIINANIFKTLRLMEKSDPNAFSKYYSQTTRRLQKLIDGHSDITYRSCEHVLNHHKGLLPIQVEELKNMQSLLSEILTDVENSFCNKNMNMHDKIKERHKQLKAIVKKLNDTQLDRIVCGTSKTRLSILFYSILGNSMMLSKQSLKLMELLSFTLKNDSSADSDFDMD
ncbi:inorganic phosphate transporter [Herbivorax sp. ANBcel31]|uniref:inorganic phosphate transporter n=1 Tax=Herbivorax sp. ANBcel31 TaxID=3069754 RepID=UPI0027B3E17A|nr:inorganic phosphate transporter [Herbivorax sp. ANBcel31]MDQ2086253.1 inorganic phosphate transporter [Herbivorax sp. ANBcel31]